MIWFWLYITLSKVELYDPLLNLAARGRISISRWRSQREIIARGQPNSTRVVKSTLLRVICNFTYRKICLFNYILNKFGSIKRHFIMKKREIFHFIYLFFVVFSLYVPLFSLYLPQFSLYLPHFKETFFKKYGKIF